jgi:beta-lactamase regulating signal transducer with metallopeptidase domain/predicted negative regulator of RcsB-dependent stress response
MTAHLIAATITASIAIIVALLLRRRSAGLRHAILLAAMLGFATPTPWLNRAGDKLAACLASPPAPVFLSLETFLARAPLTAAPAPYPQKTAESQTPRNAVLVLWAGIFTLLLAVWLRRLLRTVPSVRKANSVETEAFERARESLCMHRSVDLRITTADRVPGARGWLRPSVILPDQLFEYLSEAELHAVLAHELAHVARRDNLSAAAARAIVSAFWFHPLLWWIEQRMLAEREAACDEMVLAHGADPADYVSAILKVCRMSFAGPAGASGYAGATGSNLEHRMEQIMSAHIVRPSSRILRVIPAAVLALAALLPVAGGFLRGQDSSPMQPVTHRANDVAYQHAYECYSQHKYQEAEDLFRQLYILDPVDSRGLTGLVESFMAEGHPDEAIKLMQEEVAQHPDQPYLRLQLANLYTRTEQFDEAIAELKWVLDTGRELSSETTADIFFRMGEVNRRKGDLNEALRLFQAAADANPKDTKALLQNLMQIALLLDGTGRRDQAGPVYEQILKLDPNQPVALNNLAYLVAQKGADPDRALELAQRAANANKDLPEIQDTLGWAYLKKNRTDEAAAAFRAALQGNPNNPTFHYHLGQALLQGGDRDGAIQELQTALADHPSHNDELEIRDLLTKIAP